MARVNRALARRHAVGSSGRGGRGASDGGALGHVLRSGPAEFDPEKMEVKNSGEAVALSGLEPKILKLLFENHDRAVPRSAVIQLVWEATGNDIFDKSEVYKTAIMLREAAENSRSDKLMLKDHLSDISHQIKTPLTSLAINLENLEEYPNMAAPAREKLLRRARRDVEHMNVMIQTLLKLSRLDADVIEFAHEKTSLRDIVADAAGSVSALCELCGITLNISSIPGSEGEKQSAEKPPVIVCDKNWQTEAVTNIIKNAVEHAESKVTVECSDCELYAEITVKNDGEPVSAADRKNMFTRFYRGVLSASDSVGIGLSLADAVIRRDGGIVIVDSDESIPCSGTRVIIRYYR